MRTTAAVIMGGARNIGLAISQRLAKDGFRVIIVDILPPDDLHLHADALTADLLDRDAAAAAFAAIPGAARSRFSSTMTASSGRRCSTMLRSMISTASSISTPPSA